MSFFRSAATSTLETSINPTTAGSTVDDAPNAFFYILSKVFVENSIRAVVLQGFDNLGDFPTPDHRSLDHSDWTAILLNHDLDTLPDLLQHSVQVAGKFGPRSCVRSYYV